MPSARTMATAPIRLYQRVISPLFPRRCASRRRLQPLQQRRQRAGIQQQPLADVLDRDVVALPQRQHDQILRVGQTELVEQRLVDAVERVRGGIHCKADLIIEPERKVRRRFLR